MRSYPRNSPEAAARIIALTVLADGDIGQAELALFERLSIPAQIGLDIQAINDVLDTFCEDLLASRQLEWADACPVDERTLAELMAEIEDPTLRLKVLRLCVALAEADERVTEGESIVLGAAVEHWGLHRAMLHSTGDMPSIKAL